MQQRRKGMGSINYQTDVMHTTEQTHRLTIQRSINALTMMQRDVLLARLGTIIIGGATLFQHLCGLTTFRRPSKYQYHILQQCLDLLLNLGHIIFDQNIGAVAFLAVAVVDQRIVESVHVA